MKNLELIIENKDECKKELFRVISERDFKNTYTPESIHQTVRSISMVSELSDLVRIKTTPRTSTKKIVEHLKSRFINYGIDENNIYTQKYSQTWDGINIDQFNLVVQFPSQKPMAETIVISGHLDTVNIDKDKLSEDIDRPNYFGNTRLVIKDSENSQSYIYGFGANDMKNIFAIMLQQTKEKYFLSRPEKFLEENKWLIELTDEKFKSDLLKEYLQEIQKGKLLDRSLFNHPNNIIFVATSGEELAGHDGLVNLLKKDNYSDENKDLLAKLHNSSLWMIAEPSSGIMDAHKGYFAAKVVFDNSKLKKTDQSEIGNSLEFISAIEKKHNRRELIPYEIKDKRFSDPTFNVGLIRGVSGKINDLDREDSLKYVRLSVVGRGGHSSEPENGENAISIAADFYKKLKLHGIEDGNILTIEGGEARNIIPDKCNIILGIPLEKYDSLLNAAEILVISNRAGYAHKETKINYTPISKTEAINNITALKEKLREKVNNGYSEFECDYRPVPGQDKFKESLEKIAASSKLNPNIFLERNSYPLDSRLKNLTENASEAIKNAVKDSIDKYEVKNG